MGVHDLIMQLPAKYDTPIRERGRNLSVGQRQLISFARALLADSAHPHPGRSYCQYRQLYRTTGAAVPAALIARTHGIVIAHRLYDQSADTIVVLKRLHRGQQGTHAELLQHDGVYASLYAMGFRHSINEVNQEDRTVLRN